MRMVFIVVLILIQCGAFYIYLVHYQNCNAVMGWMVFIVSSVCIHFILEGARVDYDKEKHDVLVFRSASP